MLVSIIVPIYNVEKYLSFAIESLIKQTYNNIEIILIDDGSTDNSLKICRKYEKIDKRIRVYSIKNSGQSYARNYGVNKASADLIMFLDSDDYYEKFAVEYLLSIQKKYNAEIVLGTIRGGVTNRKFNENNITNDIIFTSKKINIEEALENMYYGKYSGISPVAKLYKKRVLVEHPFRKGVIHEDTDVAYKHLYSSKDNIVCCSEIIYNHCINITSTTQGEFTERMFYYFKAMNNNKLFILDKFPNNKYIFNSWVYMYIVGGIRIFDVILKQNVCNNYLERINLYRDEIKKYKYSFLFNSKVSIKQKIKYIMFTYIYFIYKKLYKKLKGV